MIPEAKYHASTDAGGQIPSSNFVITAPGRRGPVILPNGPRASDHGILMAFVAFKSSPDTRAQAL